MKSKVVGILLAVMLATVLGLLPALPAVAAPAPQLQARWDLNAITAGTVADLSGNGNTGTVNGATLVSGQSTLFGKALSFDGNDFVVVSVENGTLDITSTITIEAWIYPTNVGTGLGAYRNIVAKRYGNFANYALRLDDGGRLDFYYSGPSATGSATDWNVWHTTDRPVSANSWYHVAVTFTFAGGPIAAYVNGSPVTGAWYAGGPSDPATANDYALRIGMAYPGYEQYFIGKIDEVRIWSSVLDADQLDDMLPPVITTDPPKAGNIYLLNESATLSVTDGTGSPPGNGVTSVATASPANGSAIDTSTVGTHSFGATATDYAKNTTTTTITYYVRYGFSGLLAPYAPPEQKAFKLGSTIPLKWQYTDSAGNVVDSANANPAIGWVFTGAGNGSGTLEEEDAPGASGMRYDPLTMTWQFNWQTKGRSVGVYNITITSGQSGQVNGPFPIELRK